MALPISDKLIELVHNAKETTTWACFSDAPETILDRT